MKIAANIGFVPTVERVSIWVMWKKGFLVCGYHGLKMAQMVRPKKASAAYKRLFPCMKSYRGEERYGFIWVRPGINLSYKKLDSSLSMAVRFWSGLWRRLYHIKLRLSFDGLITWMDLDPWDYVHAKQYGQKEIDGVRPFPQWKWYGFGTSRFMEKMYGIRVRQRAG